MNNEKKYREIAKFCMKQKADENIAKEYEEHGMKDAMDFRSVLENPCQNDI